MILVITLILLLTVTLLFAQACARLQASTPEQMGNECSLGQCAGDCAYNEGHQHVVDVLLEAASRTDIQWKSPKKGDFAQDNQRSTHMITQIELIAADIFLQSTPATPTRQCRADIYPGLSPTWMAVSWILTTKRSVGLDITFFIHMW